MRLALVTEYVGEPDDGSRRWTDLLAGGLRLLGHHAVIVELSGNARTSALIPRNWLRVRAHRPDVVLYVPGAGLTRNALVRLAALRLIVPRAVSALAVLFGGEGMPPVPRALRAGVGLFSSRRLAAFGNGAARRAVVIPPAVDLDRFRPTDREPAAVRRELGLEPGRPLLLHVGHLRAHRNLKVLAELASGEEVQVLVVASPRFEPDPAAERRLVEAGVGVVRRFVPKIERYYQAADAYVFPVADPRGAIEVPLTVLEALACGVPVASTPFGALPDFLPPSEALFYAAPADLHEAVRSALGATRGAGRALVESLSPRDQAEVVAQACAEAGRR